MGNYTGTTNLLKVKVNIKSPKEGLVNIIDSLDSDYEECSERIVDNIINDNDDVIDMIDAVLNGNFGEVMEYSEEFKEDINVLDYISTWFLNNDTYCSGFESDITHCGNHELVTISYGN